MKRSKGFWEVEVPGFEDRDELLSKIGRWSEYEMFYRITNLHHYRDCEIFLEALLPLAIRTLGQDLRPDLAKALVFVHDDVEIRTADLSGAVKSRFTEEQQKLWESFERITVQQTIEEYAGRKIRGYDYSELIEMVFHKKTLEAQLVKLVDKFCGFNEAQHELYGGNPLFAGRYGRDTEPAIRRYERMFRNLKDEYPLLENLLKEDHPMTRPSEHLGDLREIWYDGRPHTSESILEETGNEKYDFWRKTILNQGPDGVKRLTAMGLCLRPEDRKAIAAALGKHYCNNC